MRSLKPQVNLNSILAASAAFLALSAPIMAQTEQATSDNSVLVKKRPSVENQSAVIQQFEESQSQASIDAQSWLRKMGYSLRHLNYHASFMVMRSKSDFEPYHWRHGIVDGIEMEHLSLLNGPGREVVRIGDQVSFFEPNVPAYTITSEVIDGPIPAQLLVDPLYLQRSYNFVLVGRSRVSGRAAQQIRIVSKDNSRYGFILWLDQQTALPLRLEMQDSEGQTVEQVQLTSLDVTDQVNEYFSRVEQQKMPPLLVGPSASTPAARFDLGWMPVGMHIVKEDIHRLPVTREVVDYILLSDGLVDVSVYVQKKEGQSNEKGWLTSGSNTLLTSQVGPYEVTIVGKIPTETANAIASAIRIDPP